MWLSVHPEDSLPSEQFFWAGPAVRTWGANLAASVSQRRRTSLLKGKVREGLGGCHSDFSSSCDFRAFQSAFQTPGCHSPVLLFCMIYQKILSNLPQSCISRFQCFKTCCGAVLSLQQNQNPTFNDTIWQRWCGAVNFLVSKFKVLMMIIVHYIKKERVPSITNTSKSLNLKVIKLMGIKVKTVL